MDQWKLYSPKVCPLAVSTHQKFISSVLSDVENFFLKLMVKLIFFQIRPKCWRYRQKPGFNGVSRFQIYEKHCKCTVTPIIYNGSLRSLWQTHKWESSGLCCRRIFRKFLVWLWGDHQSSVYEHKRKASPPPNLYYYATNFDVVPVFNFNVIIMLLFISEI